MRFLRHKIEKKPRADDDDDDDDDDDVDDGDDMYVHFGQYLPPIGWEGRLSPRS